MFPQKLPLVNKVIQTTYRKADPRLESRRLRPRSAAWLSGATATVLLIGWSALACLGASAESEETVGAEPGLRFEESRHDFGRVNGGESVGHEFRFVNPHAEAVRLSGVKSSCGCVVVGAWPEKVEGGETGVIAVQLDTGNYAGQVREEVIITFADAEMPPVTLELTATIWWPIEVSPRNAVFEFGRNSGADVMARVRITNHESTPLELREPVSSHRAVTARLQTQQPGQEYELTILAVPPLPAGNIFGTIRLETSSARMPVLIVPVSGLFQPDVVVSPSRLAIAVGDATGPHQVAVSIRSFWTNALEVTGVQVSRSEVGAELRTVKPGREYEMVVTIPAAAVRASDREFEVRLATNHPRFRLLRVPVMMVQGPTAP